MSLLRLSPPHIGPRTPLRACVIAMLLGIALGVLLHAALSPAPEVPSASAPATTAFVQRAPGTPAVPREEQCPKTAIKMPCLFEPARLDRSAR